MLLYDQTLSLETPSCLPAGYRVRDTIQLLQRDTPTSSVLTAAHQTVQTGTPSTTRSRESCSSGSTSVVWTTSMHGSSALLKSVTVGSRPSLTRLLTSGESDGKLVCVPRDDTFNTYYEPVCRALWSKELKCEQNVNFVCSQNKMNLDILCSTFPKAVVKRTERGDGLADASHVQYDVVDKFMFEIPSKM